jgi:hypothetical protein
MQFGAGGRRRGCFRIRYRIDIDMGGAIYYRYLIYSLREAIIPVLEVVWGW